MKPKRSTVQGHADWRHSPLIPKDHDEIEEVIPDERAERMDRRSKRSAGNVLRILDELNGEGRAQ